MAAFFKRKWARGLDYRLMKELWCYQGNWISAHFEYESRDEGGQWWRSHLYDWIATPSRPASAGRPARGLVEAVAS